MNQSNDIIDGKATWINWVYTIGGGYIWTFCGNTYIEPWVAGHLVLNRRDVGVYGYVYRPRLISGEVSLKFGTFFNL